MNLFSTTTKTLLQQLLDKEMREFHTAINSAGIDEQPNNYFHKGDVLFRTLPTRAAFQNLLRTSKVVVNDRESHIEANEPFYLFDEVTREIINIENAGNLQECLAKIAAVRESLGEMLYGALLILDDIIINPLHPLVAMELLTDHTYTNSKLNFRLTLYTYPSEDKRTSLMDHYCEGRSCTDMIEQNINDLIITSTSKVHTELSDVTTELSGDNVTLEYKVKKHEEEEADSEYYISPQQIFTKGIVMPYYGTSVLQINEGYCYGTAMSPMKSCNISSDSRIQPETFSSDRYKPSEVEVNWDSVCTGDLLNTSIEGMRSLTHSNASSPHTTYVINPGSLTYASKCIDKSLEIYTKADIIKG